MDYVKLRERARERGLTEYQISTLVQTANSSEIEGYDRLTIDENIDILLEAEKKFDEGEAYKILGLPVPPDLKERMAKLRAGASVTTRQVA